MLVADKREVAPEDVTVVTVGDEENAGPGGAPIDALPPGTAIGQYTIERLVGCGGGGIVYAARHRVLGRRVAIKVLRSDVARHPQMVARFVLEATAVNRIRHPNIVDIHEFGETAPGSPYYVMELLEGTDLREFLQVHGRFSPKEMLSLMSPVCEAVQAAHAAGFVHRDIKANNIVVIQTADERVVKLLDFGIAKITQGEHKGQGLTEPGVQLGTAHNMAPEQIRCEPVDARADIYALGILIYQLLTGRYPFDAQDPHKIAMQHLRAPAPRPSALAPIPPALDAVVLRCLAKFPEQRFSSVSELLGALHSAVGEARPDVPLSAPAVGVHVCVTGRGDDDMDDDMFEDMGAVLDDVEQALVTHEFAVPLRTSDALLGVRIVSQDEAEKQQRLAMEFVSELRAHLARRPNAHARVEVSLKSSLEQALYRSSASGVEVIGGPILSVDAWGS